MSISVSSTASRAKSIESSNRPFALSLPFSLPPRLSILTSAPGRTRASASPSRSPPYARSILWRRRWRRSRGEQSLQRASSPLRRLRRRRRGSTAPWLPRPTLQACVLLCTEGGDQKLCRRPGSALREREREQVERETRTKEMKKSTCRRLSVELFFFERREREEKEERGNRTDDDAPVLSLSLSLSLSLLHREGLLSLPFSFSLSLSAAASLSPTNAHEMVSAGRRRTLLKVIILGDSG